MELRIMRQLYAKKIIVTHATYIMCALINTEKNIGHPIKSKTKNKLKMLSETVICSQGLTNPDTNSLVSCDCQSGSVIFYSCTI